MHHQAIRNHPEIKGILHFGTTEFSYDIFQIFFFFRAKCSYMIVLMQQMLILCKILSEKSVHFSKNYSTIILKGITSVNRIYWEFSKSYLVNMIWYLLNNSLWKKLFFNQHLLFSHLFNKTFWNLQWTR